MPWGPRSAPLAAGGGGLLWLLSCSPWGWLQGSEHRSLRKAGVTCIPQKGGAGEALAQVCPGEQIQARKTTQEPGPCSHPPDSPPYFLPFSRPHRGPPSTGAQLALLAAEAGIPWLWPLGDRSQGIRFLNRSLEFHGVCVEKGKCLHCRGVGWGDGYRLWAHSPSLVAQSCLTDMGLPVSSGQLPPPLTPPSQDPLYMWGWGCGGNQRPTRAGAPVGIWNVSA